MAFAPALGLFSSFLLTFYDGQEDSLWADWLLWEGGRGKEKEKEKESEKLV